MNEAHFLWFSNFVKICFLSLEHLWMGEILKTSQNVCEWLKMNFFMAENLLFICRKFQPTSTNVKLAKLTCDT